MDTRDEEHRGDRRRIDEEAALWWSRLNTGSADVAEFARWRDADPARSVAFARVQASWESLQDINHPATAPVQPAASRRQFLRTAGIGAAVAVLGGGFFTSRAFAWDHASTQVGEFRRINLPDDSVLELNTDTAVSWRFEADVRHIRLERGEIAMMLVNGPPATLDAAVRTVALSAGRFNARVTDEGLGFTVIKGSALASTSRDGARETRKIDMGQRLAFRPAGIAVETITTEDRAMLTAWQSGDIVFENESLQGAADEYNRYLSRKIAVDAQLRSLRVGGRFSTTDPSAFLSAVSLSLGVDVVQASDGIRITPKN